ncbi:MAG: hypothetical protein WC525_08835 [Candidatus Thermoplasmatota archaeon]
MGIIQNITIGEGVAIVLSLIYAVLATVSETYDTSGLIVRKFIIVFVFICLYLCVIYWIITKIHPKSNNWGIALWVIALIVIPILIAIIMAVISTFLFGLGTVPAS